MARPGHARHGSFERSETTQPSNTLRHRIQSKMESTMATTAATSRPFDEAKLNEFVGKMLGDMGATLSAALVHIGDKLGLYKALADGGPADSETLAKRTGTAERYVREWLAAQAASGYIDYSASSGTYSLNPEQTMVFVNDQSPVYLPGFFDIAAASFRDEPKVTAAFKSGKGVGWHEHDGCLFCGTERFFRAGYNHHLVKEWLPALDGVVDALKRGIDVADVGCGHGASTILMAKAFPNSRFFGFDYHGPSIEKARAASAAEGVSERIRFEVAASKSFPGRNYGLIACFDCLHDMGDPVGAARHAAETLSPSGTFMIVEPMAGDRVEDNLSPIGRIFYAASTLICTPASLSQEVGLALGAQAGEARLKSVLMQGGFERVRRAAATPFNMVLEGRL
jgi:SAM-dependent methyltransferase